MTDKRFIIDDAGSLIDMHTRDTFDYVSDVCDLLNEQYETIQQLQHDASILIQANQDYRKENEQLKFQLDECQNHKLYSRRELEKENEQLKKAIVETEKMVQSTYDELTTQVMKNILDKNISIK